MGVRNGFKTIFLLIKERVPIVMMIKKVIASPMVDFTLGKPLKTPVLLVMRFHL